MTSAFAAPTQEKVGVAGLFNDFKQHLWDSGEMFFLYLQDP